MPELPEAETLCRQLKDLACGLKIKSVSIMDPKLESARVLAGTRIIDVERHGKQIRLVLDNNRSAILHLRMTGRFQWQKEKDAPPHSRVRFDLGKGCIFFIDPRRFGTITLTGRGEAPPGKDALKLSDPGWLLQKSRRRRTAVKSFLLDQNVISGIGNIYASEILHRAKIDPVRPASSLSIDEWKAVTKATRSVLKKAVMRGGSSISDWKDLYGIEGSYQDGFMVYAREGRRCERCGGLIKKIKITGRGTYFCSLCQK